MPRGRRVSIDKDYTLAEVAEAMGMSERWLRRQVAEGAEHMRFGHKIRFTAEQVDKLRAGRVQNAVPQSITTGRKRRP